MKVPHTRARDLSRSLAMDLCRSHVVLQMLTHSTVVAYVVLHIVSNNEQFLCFIFAIITANCLRISLFVFHPTFPAMVKTARGGARNYVKGNVDVQHLTDAMVGYVKKQ